MAKLLYLTTVIIVYTVMIRFLTIHNIPAVKKYNVKLYMHFNMEFHKAIRNIKHTYTLI